MIAEGQAAPDFTLDDQDGRAVSLASLRGSVVVLYFVSVRSRHVLMAGVG